MTERVVVISGASGATGREAAKAFAARGDRLVLLGREQAQSGFAGAELDLPEARILCREVDLTDGQALPARCKEGGAEFGGAHILIHLVGGWTGGKTLVETDPGDLEMMLSQHA